MKKKVLLFTLSLCMILAAVGCKKDGDTDTNPTPSETEGTDTTDGSETDETSDSAEAPEPVVNTVVKEEYKLVDYITLGKYKGIEVTVKQLEVTESDIDVAIQLELSESGSEPKEVTGRAIQKGDTVNIDFEGLKDGVAFEGGTAQAQDLTIGSGAFIPGFEEQLIGANTGDKKAINVTFPDNYGNTDLAGQPVVFNVTVNKIQQFELTEDYIKTNTGFDNVTAYRESVGKDLEDTNVLKMAAQKENDVYQAIIDGSEITVPQNLLDFYSEDIKVYYTNTAAAYGMDLKSFLEIAGASEEVFEADVKEYAETMATKELVLGAIIEAEKLELSEEEYQEGVTKYAEQYGFESNEEFLANSDEDMLREDLLYRKALDFIVAQAVEL